MHNKKLLLLLLPFTLPLLANGGCNKSNSKKKKESTTTTAQHLSTNTTNQPLNNKNTNTSPAPPIPPQQAKKLLDLFYQSQKNNNIDFPELDEKWKTAFLTIDKQQSVISVKEEDTGNSLFHLAIENVSHSRQPFEALLRRLEQEFIAQKRPGDLKSFIMSTLQSTKNKQDKSPLELPTTIRTNPQSTIDTWVTLYNEQRGPNKKPLYKKYDKPGFLQGPSAVYPLTHPLAESLKKGLNIQYGCGNKPCKAFSEPINWLPFGTGVINSYDISRVLKKQPKCSTCNKKWLQFKRAAILDCNYWVWGHIGLKNQKDGWGWGPEIDRDVEAIGKIALENELAVTINLAFGVSE